MKILIKQGRVIDPSQEMDKVTDIFIDGGKISRLGKAAGVKADVTIQAEGRIVAPGLIDMHAHLREPGREDTECVESGLTAAVRGGFTTVCAMPNTEPPCDSQAQARFLLARARAAAMANLLPVGTITRERKGLEISEMGELKDAGCPAVSDDGDGVMNPGLMRRAMEYAAMTDLLVISHCEDKTLANSGVMHEGYFSTVLGLRPIPALAESMMVERDIQLAHLTGARLHIAHISTAESAEKVKQAKEQGIKVTAEVTPHHLVLTDEDLKTYDTNLKVNPPLRSAQDVRALKKALKDGTIDAIATDHAPHLASEKEKEFDYAPFGMTGLETALALMIMNLVDKGILSWIELLRKLSANPAAILKCGGGTLKEGAPADITVIDPEKKWIYAREGILSRSSNSPFVGREMKGAVTDVIVGGRAVLRDGVICGRK
ncbi:MAG: dihydroorotase [Candidatus Omnitrophota bacterium]